ncbi:MAG TPA: quinoprotein relay system zinc metallohydrolase 2 [Rudaea sp.]|jgi:quinoprotein relay system zinc metallohydrolase 2|uniref:quinoprotein relay system zinc metallohydrolase 2 n=1 Tax=Rudaea sp. TaxID=2136325 RepID=UPI002F959EFD
MIVDAVSRSALRWFAAAALFVAPWMATAAPAAFDLREVAPGVFVHLGKPLALDAPGHDDIANIGFIVGTRCVAVIDTGGSVRIGRALRAAIRRRTPLPICYVINTHVHVDHVLGNFAFAEDHPSFVGHAALAAALARSREFFLRQYTDDFEAPATPAQIIAPDRGVETMLDLDLGDRHLTLRAWPKAHTDCDLTVFDEKTATLWTGDLLFRERLPALDGSVKGWLAALDVLARMSVKLVVPGHGGIAHDLAAALAPERRYLQALVDGVRSEIAQGKPIDDAMAHVGTAEKSHWLLWDSTHAHNVARAYQELEWE